MLAGWIITGGRADPGAMSMTWGHFIIHSMLPNFVAYFATVFFHSEYDTESEKEKQLISRITGKQYGLASILL